ncbi:MAG: amidohydrolase family protein [Cyclobacteriaceae bacterium]
MKNILVASFLCLSVSLFAQRTIIHAGTLIDGVSKKPIKAQSIIVEGERITGVEKGYVEGNDVDEIIDLKNMTVMPGFIDLHVHIESQSSPATYLNRFRHNPADVAYEAAMYAKSTLMAGFTTVRDLGGSGVNVSLRNAINKGLTDGPRIFTTEKSLAVTGGHADPTNGYRADLQGDPGPKEGVVNGVEDAAKAVRQRYKNGADLIKITATGGVLSVAKDGMGPHFKEEEIRAIVETARDFNFHVAAHAHGDEGMARAVRAGVLTIEHGTYMSEQTMDLMIEKGAYLIPTISAGMSVAKKAEIPGYFPKVVADKARVIGPQILDKFSQAYKRGVPIAFGTDAGVFNHGENAMEFMYMVQGGMPAMEAIICATSTAAKVLDEGENIGGIKAGLYADIVAVTGNPLEDIKQLQDIDFVMKGGTVYQK